MKEIQIQFTPMKIERTNVTAYFLSGETWNELRGYLFMCLRHEKKVVTMMVNNSTNNNKMSKHHTLNLWKQKQKNRNIWC